MTVVGACAGSSRCLPSPGSGNHAARRRGGARRNNDQDHLDGHSRACRGRSRNRYVAHADHRVGDLAQVGCAHVNLKLTLDGVGMKSARSRAAVLVRHHGQGLRSAGERPARALRGQREQYRGSRNRFVVLVLYLHNRLPGRALADVVNRPFPLHNHQAYLRPGLRSRDGREWHGNDPRQQQRKTTHCRSSIILCLHDGRNSKIYYPLFVF